MGGNKGGRNVGRCLGEGKQTEERRGTFQITVAETPLLLEGKPAMKRLKAWKLHRNSKKLSRGVFPELRDQEKKVC